MIEIIPYILLFLIVYLFWVMKRNHNVCAFCISVLEWESKKQTAKIDKGEKLTSYFPIYDSMPSYDRMLFSFRKLTSYLPKEHLADYKNSIIGNSTI